MTLEVYALPGRRPANVGEQPRILVYRSVDGSIWNMSATSRIVYRSMLDIVAARMTRRTPLRSSQLEA